MAARSPANWLRPPYSQEVPVALLGIGPARNELRFLNRAGRAGGPALHFSRVVIYVADRRTAVGAAPRYHVAVLVTVPLVPVVGARQLARDARQRPQGIGRFAVREVEGELRQDGRRRRERLARRGRKKVEARAVIEADIEVDLRAVLIRIHHVAGAHGGTPEPADVARGAVARHDRHLRLFIRMPLVKRRSALDRFDVGDEGEERKHRVVGRHREIVDHARPRHFEPDLVDHSAIAIERVEDDVFGAVALGLIREGEHFVVNQVELGVGAQAHARDGAAEIGTPAGFQRLRVELIRQVVFLQRQELARVEHQVGVGGSVPGAAGRGVIGEAVPIAPEQRATRLLLEDEALGANPSAHVVDLSSREAEGVHHAFAIDEDVGAIARRVLAIGPAPQQSPFDLRRQVAFHQLQAANGGLHPIGMAPSLIERDVRKSNLHGFSSC